MGLEAKMAMLGLHRY